jgi:hypothetical protein
MVDKGKRYALIQKKEEIQKYLEELNIFEKENLFQKLKDIFYVYGFSPEEVKGFISSTGDLKEYSDHQVLNLEGVANSLLFELKYKRKK